MEDFRMTDEEFYEINVELISIDADYQMGKNTQALERKVNDRINYLNNIINSINEKDYGDYNTLIDLLHQFYLVRDKFKSH